MNVRELIERLSEYSGDTDVVVEAATNTFHREARDIKVAQGDSTRLYSPVVVTVQVLA